MAKHSPSSLLAINNSELRDAAILYAQRGWPVLPLGPQLKTPLTNHGLLDATVDENIITNWWHRWPQANIGLRTGVEFDVLDIDGKKDSVAWHSMFTLTGGQYQHPGPTSATGKGYHLLFAVTGARNFANKLPGLDFRGQSGYIMASPSIHPNGNRYQWIRDGELPPHPHWLDNLLKPARTTDVTPRDRSDQQPILEAFEIWEADHPLNQRGRTYMTTCIFPNHQDDTPSFALYPDTNTYYCYGCNAWGDAYDLNQFQRTGIPRDVSN